MKWSILALCCVASTALATDVSGVVGSGVPTTWDASMNPIRVVGHVSVPSGQTLRVEPGTEVYFTEPTESFSTGSNTPRQYTIFVDGAMSVGTAGQARTLFTREQPTELSRGGGIHMRTGASFTMVNATVEYQLTDNATLGASVDEYGGAIGAYRANLTIQDSLIQHNLACIGGGVAAYVTSGYTALIEDTIITENEAFSCAFNAAGGGGLSVINYGGSATVRDVVLSRNTYTRSWSTAYTPGQEPLTSPAANSSNFEGGGGLALTGNTPTVIDHVTIAYNTGTKGPGIHLNGAKATVTNSVIWGNTGGAYGEQVTFQAGTNQSSSGAQTTSQRGISFDNIVVPPSAFTTVWRNNPDPNVVFDGITNAIVTTTDPFRNDFGDLACYSPAIDAGSSNTSADAFGNGALDDTASSGSSRDWGGIEFVGNSSDDDNSNGICNAEEPPSDADGDGVVDGSDTDPNNAYVCGDADGDLCDDCAIAGTPDTNNDGMDRDADGLCDLGDDDADGDTVLNADDSAPLDPLRCEDTDADGCDDCAIAGAPEPLNDGPDAGGDGICDTPTALDECPQDPQQSTAGDCGCGFEDRLPGAARACVSWTALVADDAVLGAETFVLDRARVGTGAQIGASVVIGKHSRLGNNVSIGALSIIQRGATLLHNADISTGVVIGRSVTVGASTVSSNVSVGYASTIGDGCTIGPSSVIGNLATVGDNVVLGPTGAVILARSVAVGDGSDLADGVVIGPDTTLLANVQIDANSRIRKNTTVGSDTLIGAGARIGRSAAIGSDCEIAAGVRMGASSELPTGECIYEDNAVIPRDEVAGETCL